MVFKTATELLSELNVCIDGAGLLIGFPRYTVVVDGETLQFNRAGKALRELLNGLDLSKGYECFRNCGGGGYS